MILEKRLKKMLVKKLQSECLARGFSDSGTAPELCSRIGLELAGKNCKCRNVVASGVVVAVTAEANVLTTDADEGQTAIAAELRAEHAGYLAAIDEEVIAREAATAQAAIAENNSVGNEEAVITRVRSTIEMEVMRSCVEENIRRGVQLGQVQAEQAGAVCEAVCKVARITDEKFARIFDLREGDLLRLLPSGIKAKYADVVDIAVDEGFLHAEYQYVVCSALEDYGMRHTTPSCSGGRE